MKAIAFTLALFLSACVTAPPLDEAKPTAVFIVADCTGDVFLVAVDSHGGYAIIGGTAKPTPEQIELAKKAFETVPEDSRFRLRAGDCQTT